MPDARDFDPASIRPRGGHYINGVWETGRGDIEVRRPSDNQPYGEIPEAGPEGVDQAVRVAHAALKSSGWATRAPRERARVMRRWAELVEADAATLGQLEAVGSTRPVNDAVTWDVPFTAKAFVSFPSLPTRWAGTSRRPRQITWEWFLRNPSVSLASALLEALDAGRLSQAILDVTEAEPLPPSHRFWTHPGVIVTPHIAGSTRPESAALVLIDNIRRHQRGEPLLDAVDRSRGY